LEKELLAHGRTKTIGSDQQLCRDLPPVREGSPHAIRVLLDAEERMIEVIIAVGHHLSDQLVKPVPRRYRLWKGKASDDRPVIVEGDTLRDVDSDSVGPCATFIECMKKLRVAHDPGATPCQFNGRAFEDVNMPSPPPKQRANEKAGCRSSDDDGAWSKTKGRRHLSPSRLIRGFARDPALRRAQALKSDCCQTAGTHHRRQSRQPPQCREAFLREY